MRRAIVLAGVLAWALVGAGPPDAPREPLELTVEPATATVGDALRACVTLQLPADAPVQGPELPETLGPFAVRQAGWDEPPAAGSGRRWCATLVPWRTGVLEVPALEFRLGAGQVWRSEPRAVEVRSVLDEEGEGGADLADLKPPAALPPDLRGLWLTLGTLAGLLAVAWFARWLYRRLAPRLAAAPAPDPLQRMPAHAWAYARLQELLERRQEDPSWAERFFDELSRIVKRYLEARFRVELLERTTAESVSALGRVGAPAAIAARVGRLLAEADAVKFARAPVDEGRCRAAVEAAYALVDATRPAEERDQTAA